MVSSDGQKKHGELRLQLEGELGNKSIWKSAWACLKFMAPPENSGNKGNAIEISTVGDEIPTKQAGFSRWLQPSIGISSVSPSGIFQQSRLRSCFFTFAHLSRAG